jgi:SAM-dependent methyltransferase
VPSAELVHADLTRVEFAAGSIAGVASFYALNHVPRELLASTFRNVHRWLVPGGLLLASLGQRDTPGCHETFFGAPSYFSGFPSDVNRRLLRDAGFELLRDEVVSEPEPERSGTFQWVLARS